MTIDGEPAKALLSYLQRADELQKHDHLAAYYCRLYAMEKGLRIPVKERTSETKAILVSLMNQLEKDKKVVKLSPDDNMYMEGFALRVFAKADKQDRAGHADLKTAITFYVASIFFEVLLQFGELPPDIREKKKYANWKAVDIRKALAEGRKPVPGPPFKEKDLPVFEVDTIWGTVGATNSAPESTPQPMAPPQDSTFRATSTRNIQPPSSEPPFHQSYSEVFNLTSAPSNPIPPSYNQNSNAGYPPSYPHSSGTPFDSLGGKPATIDTYSYPSDPPGFTTSPLPGYSSYQQDPHQQQPHWSGSSSAYPSGGHQPQYHPGASRPSEPIASASESPTGYHRNGSYDSEYKPPSGTMVEAHKASRFAVSALACDDVPTAISHLRRSLELLTSPSASVD